MNSIDVCLSPELIHLYTLEEKTVVIVDILRATSCMTAGIHNKVEGILPFANLDDCRAMKKEGYFIAGERNGEKVDGFDLGNSPFEYLQEDKVGMKIAVTTTNGTLALEKSKGAPQIIIGSFLNKTAIAKWVSEKNNDVMVVCAGWKGRVNMEDTLYAGALVELLKDNFTPACDAPRLAASLYKEAKYDLMDYMSQSSHVVRLKNLNIEKDIEYCLTEDIIEEVPVFDGHWIVSGIKK